jgi:hypothetical protein
VGHGRGRFSRPQEHSVIHEWRPRSQAANRDRKAKRHGGSRKDGAFEVEAAELLAALEAEQVEEGERTGPVSTFDDEPSAE